ncbi:hypothetical protein B0I37DRAFT_422306 [Chaetomium sp. MPI-CAGE-AT-0009]|nr:hypothetical protein B0I37DRAFT_422306 [Chaetomium sp. MPI-CAGE-AT-0009]
MSAPAVFAFVVAGNRAAPSPNRARTLLAVLNAVAAAATPGATYLAYRAVLVAGRKTPAPSGSAGLAASRWATVSPSSPGSPGSPASPASPASLASLASPAPVSVPPPTPAQRSTPPRAQGWGRKRRSRRRQPGNPPAAAAGKNTASASSFAPDPPSPRRQAPSASGFPRLSPRRRLFLSGSGLSDLGLFSSLACGFSSRARRLPLGRRPSLSGSGLSRLGLSSSLPRRLRLRLLARPALALARRLAALRLARHRGPTPRCRLHPKAVRMSNGVWVTVINEMKPGYLGLAASRWAKK